MGGFRNGRQTTVCYSVGVGLAMAMTQDDLNRLADTWLGYWHAPEGSPIRGSFAWAGDRVMDLRYDDEPEELWRLILLHRKDQSPFIQQVLSAGPVDDLLAKYGEVFIERVELEAHADPSFAKLLGGVWQSRMSDSVWARVQAVWDRRGWDGIPE
jgi:hypothetical protein